MLRQVVVNNSKGDILVLDLDQVSSGIVVEDIQGLDPVKATLTSSTFASMDGAQYQSGRLEPRNIKFRLGLEPDWSVEDVQAVRYKVYQFFMPKTKISMEFNEETLESVARKIEGYVESVETALFTSEPAMDISVMCFDPDFVAFEPIVIAGTTVADGTNIEIDYQGDVETGFEFEFLLDRDITEWTIKSVTADDEIRTMEFNYSVGIGNVVYISTAPGNKYVELTYLGERFSILDAKARLSPWIDLKPGINLLNINVAGAPIPYNISYFNRYGGL